MRRTNRSLPWQVAALLGALAVGGRDARAAAPVDQYQLTADTVRDTKSGLTWQRTVSASSYSVTTGAAYCAGLSLGGWSTGWRLPSVEELQGIVDRRVASPGPTIDAVAFPSTPNTFFWTRTQEANAPIRTWYVFFRDGGSSTDVGGTQYRVRCVHD